MGGRALAPTPGAASVPASVTDIQQQGTPNCSSHSSSHQLLNAQLCFNFWVVCTASGGVSAGWNCCLPGPAAWLPHVQTFDMAEASAIITSHFSEAPYSSGMISGHPLGSQPGGRRLTQAIASPPPVEAPGQRRATASRQAGCPPNP